MPGKDKPPQPSAQEQALLQQQRDFLTQQQAYLSQAGGFLSRPKSEAEMRAEAIQKQYDERLQRSLAGDVPVDPNLEREIAEGKVTLETQLFQALGPNYAASTAGQNALRDYDDMAKSQRFRARESFIAGTEPASFNRFSLGQETQQQQGFLGPLRVAGAFGEGASSISPTLDYYSRERFLPYQAENERRARNLAALGQLGQAGASFYTQGIRLPRSIDRLGNTGFLSSNYNPAAKYVGLYPYLGG